MTTPILISLTLLLWSLTIVCASRTAALRERRRGRVEPRPEPTCGCGHHLSFHEAPRGGCLHTEHWNGQCGCQRYVEFGNPLAAIEAAS